MTIKEYQGKDNEKSISFKKIAKILDGQHRLAGLDFYEQSKDFQINISIFVGADIADQAMVFSTVNLAQTKVNKSLAYDLYDFAKKRSPQKSAHNIVVALNKEKESPFYEKIKRLGTSSRQGNLETITQATFIKSLLRFITSNEIKDRDDCYRTKKIKSLENPLETKLIFRNLWINKNDVKIANIIWIFFDAVKRKWPNAWSDKDKDGLMLSRTNGFKACMRILRDIYKDINQDNHTPTTEKFSTYLEKSKLEDKDFNTDKFKPGSSGEATLYKSLYDDILEKLS